MKRKKWLALGLTVALVMSPVTGVYAQEENSSGIENTTVKGAKGDVSTSGDEDPAVVSEEGENITVEVM